MSVQELVQGLELELEQAWVQELACYCCCSNHLNCSAELPLYYHYFHYPYYHLPESPQNHRHRYCRYLRLPSASRSLMLSSRKWMSMLWWSLSWLLWLPWLCSLMWMSALSSLHPLKYSDLNLSGGLRQLRL